MEELLQRAEEVQMLRELSGLCEQRKSRLGRAIRRLWSGNSSVSPASRLVLDSN
jgi:hypothetical protein